MILGKPRTERELLQASLTECNRVLQAARAEGDDLAADLAQSDLNAMLDKLAQLPATEDTEATE